jgi:hypothetical protein
LNPKIFKIISTVVVIALLGTLIYVKFFTPEDGMHLIVEVEDAASLEVDNAVTCRGFIVGRIAEMQLKSDFSGKIIIDVHLNKADLALPKTATYASITDADLLGTKQLEISYDYLCEGDCLQNYDTLKGTLGSYFDRELEELQPFFNRTAATFEGVDTFVQNWKRRASSDYEIQSELAAKQLKEMTKNFKQATERATVLTEKSSKSYARIKKNSTIVLTNFEQADAKLIQQNLEILQRKVDEFDLTNTKKMSAAALKDLEVTTKQLAVTKELLNTITGKMNVENGGSLAKILNDPRFQASDPNKSSKSIADYAALLEDIRLNPGKYTSIW